MAARERATSMACSMKERPEPLSRSQMAPIAAHVSHPGSVDVVRGAVGQVNSSAQELGAAVDFTRERQRRPLGHSPIKGGPAGGGSAPTAAMRAAASLMARASPAYKAALTASASMITARSGSVAAARSAVATRTETASPTGPTRAAIWPRRWPIEMATSSAGVCCPAWSSSLLARVA